MKRFYSLVLPLLLLLCILPACGSRERTPEERITAVLETIYNVPDKYHREHAKDLDGSSSKTLGEVTQAWLQHDQDRFYAEDFAEGVLEKYCVQWMQNMIFPEMQLLSHGAQSTVKQVDTAPSEKDGLLYHFTAAVTLQDRNGAAADYNITGNVRMDEAGKIAEFRILDVQDFSVAVTQLP